MPITGIVQKMVVFCQNLQLLLKYLAHTANMPHVEIGHQSHVAKVAK